MKTAVALLLLLAPFVAGKVFKLNDCLVTSEGGEGDITEELKNCTVKMAGQGRFFFQLNHCGPTAPVSKIDVHGICPAALEIRNTDKASTDHICNGDVIKAAAENNLPALKIHESDGCNMAVADYDNRTALHLAAAQGHADCVTFLLYTCLVPFQPLDRWQHTPLSEARRHNHPEVANTIAEWIGPFAPNNFVADTDTDYEGLTVNEDCRKLCQVTTGCEFFNFRMQSSGRQSVCSLKTELGKIKNGAELYFGHRDYIGEVLADSSVTICVQRSTLIIGSGGAVFVTVLLILLVSVVLTRRFRTEDFYEDVRGLSERPPTSSTDSGGNVYRTMSKMKSARPVRRDARFVPFPGPSSGAPVREEVEEAEGSRASSNVYYVPGEEDTDYD